MRKANIKKELAYHEGAYAVIIDIQCEIDNLLCESNHYRENEKLWRLRDKVYKLYDEALSNIRVQRSKLK